MSLLCLHTYVHTFQCFHFPTKHDVHYSESQQRARPISYDLMVPLQQQIHAQQVPGGPPQPMGALNPFGALGATMGLPHGPQGLLNKPPEHHRPDIKPTGLEGPAAAEERLVSTTP